MARGGARLVRLRSDGGGLNSPSPAADRPGQGGVVQAKATRGLRRAQRRKVPEGVRDDRTGFGNCWCEGTG